MEPQGVKNTFGELADADCSPTVATTDADAKTRPALDSVEEEKGVIILSARDVGHFEKTGQTAL